MTTNLDSADTDNTDDSQQEVIDNVLDIEVEPEAGVNTDDDGDSEADEAGQTDNNSSENNTDDSNSSSEEPDEDSTASTQVDSENNPVDSDPAATDIPSPPPADKETKPAAETEVAALNRQNDALRRQLNELAKLGLNLPQPTAAPPVSNADTGSAPPQSAQPASAPAAAPVAAPVQATSLDAIRESLSKDVEFLSQEELDSIIDNPSLINTAINKAVKASSEAMLSAIPIISTSMANEAIMLNNMALDFYEANPDLAQYKPFVSAVVVQVEAANNGKTYQEIFDITAGKVRERLGLSSPSGTPEKVAPSGGKPTFAGTRGPARKAAPAVANPDDMATQIANMLD